MASENRYFGMEQNLLTYKDVPVAKEEFLCSSLGEALSNLGAGEFKVAAWMMNELKMGYYKNGSFSFADTGELNEKYLLELRVFNKDKELYVIKRGEGFSARIISEGSGEALKAIDSTSVIFGSQEEIFEGGFVKLFETGRKISLVIPSYEVAARYTLTTRSYVTNNKATGQAGFGFYRWVEIAAEKGDM